MTTTRRDFLKFSLGTTALASLGSAGPAIWGRPAWGASQAADRDTVLIVVQLAGGNDGLNTVVPYADDAYARSRKTLRLAGSQVHKIDDHLGFHPKMQAFKRLYDEGLLSVVQGVAYPNQNGSHPRSMEIWQTAVPEQTNCQTGWLGRMVDAVCEPGEGGVPAVFVGGIARPFALNAERVIVPTIRSLSQYASELAGDGSAGAPRASSDNPLLDFVGRQTAAARAAAAKIEKVVKSPAGAASYPDFQLAQTFRAVAQLMRADLGIRVFYAELGGNSPGGFDNHANQFGNHDALLHELAESAAALVDDLKRDGLLERVVAMTFSEFGRTLDENGRRGTDHGEAAPVFLVGGGLRGGLIGSHPSLMDLRGRNPKFHTDFRRVYATMLDGWLGFDSLPILGQKFEPLDVLA
jgi:uncharacterized protein (DUF1501 family)